MKTILTIQAADPQPRTTTHRGQAYVGLALGQRYEVQVKNTTPRRILAVVTVDGKNVLDGSPGSASGAGMIIEPMSAYSFQGWRTDTETVAAFRLTPREESYAAKSGDASNVGVIGLAVFDEHRSTYVPAMRSATRGLSASIQGSVTRGGATRSAGTGFGEARASRVTTGDFKRSSHAPVEVHTIRYDDVNTLIELGIITEHRHGDPDPFPADKMEFCKPPS